MRLTRTETCSATVAKACVELDGDHRLLVPHQAAEEISHNFQQAVLLREQLLTVGSLIIFTDAGPSVDPGAANVSAHGARCNADLGVVANALHLACIRFGINVEDDISGRAMQSALSEPDGSARTGRWHPAFWIPTMLGRAYHIARIHLDAVACPQAA